MSAQVAVEVDGPLHFVSGKPDGPTVWRGRMLQKRGWKVVSVPVVTWQRFRDKAQRKKWLLQQFQIADIYLVSGLVWQVRGMGEKRMCS